MIMRLNLERAGPAIANVNDAGILPRPLQYAPAVYWQPLQMNPRRFVGAVFAPHHAEDTELGQRRFTPTQQGFDPFVFLHRQPVISQSFGSDSQGRCGHVGKFYCRIFRMLRTNQIQELFTAEIAEIRREIMKKILGALGVLGGRWVSPNILEIR